MLSIYPRSIPTFPSHRNLLDDVDAAHINNIQRELTSVAGILGVSPQVYNDVTVPQTTTAATPGDTGGLDPDMAYETTPRSYNPQVRIRDHGSVSRRLDFLERGRQNHCFRLSAHSINVPASSTISYDKRPRGIRFPKPGNFSDPFNMYNGIGVTLRKSGFWVFHGSVVLNLLGSTEADRDGTYEAAIDKDNQWLEGMVRFIHTETNKDMVLNPTVAGFFPRGTKITLRFAHNSIRSHNIRLARLAGFMIRENDEVAVPDNGNLDVYDNGATTTSPYLGDPATFVTTPTGRVLDGPVGTYPPSSV